MRVRGIELYRTDLRTRMPFRYGIATMVDVPHVLLRLDLETEGGSSTGFSADHLPPKWFTKDPDRDPREEIDEMLTVIRQAISLAEGRDAATPFDLWWSLYHDQARGSKQQGLPPLLGQFGVTLVERAMIDAWCRARGTAFPAAVHENRLGIELGRIHESLTGSSPAAWLPASAPSSVHVRHTVGLSDPLRDADITETERLSDGLPQSLEACIHAYGLTHFKLKVQGDPESDLARLRRIARVLEERLPGRACASLDGNESFPTARSFSDFWLRLRAEAELDGLLDRLLFVEQPLHRSTALREKLEPVFRPGGEPCPVIIDESDAEIDSLPQALDLGYAGTSHKNCKGVFKGIANRCLIQSLDNRGEGPFMMSGEDLANVGPVALLQDLAVQATLGITSVERNGHHYFAGLSAFPDRLQDTVVTAHDDLFGRDPGQPARLRIHGGMVRTGSVLGAPFGCDFVPDLDSFSRKI
jgi:hypothetical protein